MKYIRFIYANGQEQKKRFTDIELQYARIDPITTLLNTNHFYKSLSNPEMYVRSDGAVAFIEDVEEEKTNHEI